MSPYKIYNYTNHMMLHTTGDPRIFLLVMITTGFISCLHADTITLKGGLEIEGNIVSSDGDEINVTIDDEEVSFPKEEVEAIQKNGDTKEQVSLPEEIQFIPFTDSTMSLSIPKIWEQDTDPSYDNSTRFVAKIIEPKTIQAAGIHFSFFNEPVNPFNYALYAAVKTFGLYKSFPKLMHFTDNSLQKYIERQGVTVTKKQITLIGKYLWFIYEGDMQGKKIKYWKTVIRKKKGLGFQARIISQHEDLFNYHAFLIEKSLKTLTINKLKIK